MIEIHESAAQGDVLFTRVEELPDGVKLETEGERAIVAHSETGHHHVAVASKVRFFSTMDPSISYIEADADVDIDVVHERNHDTHQTLRLVAAAKTKGKKSDKPAKKSTWRVKRQREATPAGTRRVAD